MIDIDKLEDEIKNIVDPDSVEEATDFVLTTKNNTEVQVVEEQLPEVIQATTDKFEEDFDYVRNNLKDIIAQGGSALQQALAIASSMENPRSYEVVATIMKSLADINKDLLSAHKSKDERTVNIPQSQTNIQNNTVFVGSTAEFSKLMKERMQK